MIIYRIYNESDWLRILLIHLGVLIPICQTTSNTEWRWFLQRRSVQFIADTNYVEIPSQNYIGLNYDQLQTITNSKLIRLIWFFLQYKWQCDHNMKRRYCNLIRLVNFYQLCEESAINHAVVVVCACKSVHATLSYIWNLANVIVYFLVLDQYLRQSKRI